MSRSEPKIGIVEIFHSIQGEGFHAGRDAIFVRTAGCNLSCVFAQDALCDTPYMNATKKLTLDELFDEVMMLIEGKALRGLGGDREHATMLIFTGGEPTIQPQFDKMVHRADQSGFYTALETNGTQWKESIPFLDWVTVSPKDQVSQGSPFEGHNQNPQDPRVADRVLEHMTFRGMFIGLRGEFRYVISEHSPTPHYLPPAPHYLSPTVLSDGTGLEWKSGFPGFAPGAVERCLEIIQEDPRFRLSIQTHKILGVR